MIALPKRYDDSVPPRAGLGKTFTVLLRSIGGIVSQGSSSGSQTNSDGRSRRDPQVTAAYVGAGAIVAAALIAGFFTFFSGDDTSASPSPSPSKTTEAPKDEELKASLSPSPATDAPTSNATGTEGIYRSQKNVLIAETYGIDLDASEDESKDWRYGNGATADGHDLWYSTLNTIWAESRIVEAAPNRAACDVTGYSDILEREKVTTGTTFCVKTGADRLARVTITKTNPDPREITVDIVVWK